jgi:RTX calcium-binding nonapeptide repeat (4 copies)
MSDFDDFWTAIYSPSMPISDESRDALKAAMAVIYNSTNTDAVRIITALRNAGRPIDFFASSSSGWSTTVSLFRITVPQQGGDLVTVKSFNTQGQWVEEPLYKTLAHELAHLVLAADDPPGSSSLATPAANLTAINGSADMLGDAERTANSIAASNGGAVYKTASYFLTDALNKGFGDFDPSVSYTFGNAITGGVSIASLARTSDEFSMGYTIDRRAFQEGDLLIGGRGGDLIFGAKGNNYIYGYGGHDVIVPGASNNIVDGGLPFARIGGVAVVDYQLKSGMRGGVTVDFRASIPTDIKSANAIGDPIIPITSNGTGGIDYLLNDKILRFGASYVYKNIVYFTQATVTAYSKLDQGLVIDDSHSLTADEFHFADFLNDSVTAGFVRFIPVVYELSYDDFRSTNGSGVFGAAKGVISVYIPPHAPTFEIPVIQGDSQNTKFNIGQWSDIGAVSQKTPILVDGGGGDKNEVRLQDINGHGVEVAVSTAHLPQPPDDGDVTGSTGGEGGAPNNDSLPEIFSPVHGDFLLRDVQLVQLPDFANRVSVAGELEATKEHVIIDAGSSTDNVLDFSSYGGSLYLGDVKGGFDVYRDNPSPQQRGHRLDAVRIGIETDSTSA